MAEIISSQQERGNYRQHLSAQREAELEKLVKQHQNNEEQTDSGFVEEMDDEGEQQDDHLHQQENSKIMDLEEKTNRLTIHTDATSTCAETTEANERQRNQQAYVERVRTAVRNQETNEDGDTFLHVAIIHRRKFPDGLAEFVVNCAPETAYLNRYNALKQTPLQLCVITKESRIVRTLIEKGARIDLPDRNGNLPLHIASENGDVACVTEITRPANDIQFASYFPNIGTALSNSLDATNYQGFTPLQLAVRRGHKHIAQYLVQTCGADIDARDDKSGYTALHHAVEAKNLDMVMHLISKCKANINAQSRTECTPLHLAAGLGLKSITNFLLAAGANPHIRNDEGDVPYL